MTRPAQRILVAYALAAELGDMVLPEGVERTQLGVGPVESALSLARLLTQGRYTLVINVGIGGGFGDTPIGSQVLVRDEYYVDIGREDGSTLSLPQGYALVDHVCTDAELSKSVLAHCMALTSGPQAATPVRSGSGITSAQITTSDARASVLQSRVPSAQVESMEGFAVVRCAQQFAVPVLELRGISNRVGDRSRAAWDFQAGTKAARDLLRKTLDHVLR